MVGREGLTMKCFQCYRKSGEDKDRAPIRGLCNAVTILFVQRVASELSPYVYDSQCVLGYIASKRAHKPNKMTLRKFLQMPNITT